MRVVHVSRDFPPAPSGIGDYTDRIATEMTAVGDRVAVVCSAPAEVREHFDVRPVVRDWTNKGVPAIAAAVRAERPDAIVWHYNPFQIGSRGLAPVAAGRLARALADIAPLTVALHEMFYPWGRSGLKGFVWAVVQRAQLKAVVEAARSLIVTTPARKAGVKKRFPKADVTFVPVGPTVLPVAEANGFRARHGIAGDAFVVAHLGAIGEGRDLEPALDAVETLVLIGRTGVEAPRKSNVVCTGPLDPAGLSEALASADAYLFAEPTGPSSRKTSLISALAHGLPVIAYRPNDGVAQSEPQFRDGENVLLVSPNAAEIAAAIGSLQDPATAKRLGEAAKELAETHYGWHSITEQIRKVVGKTR